MTLHYELFYMGKPVLSQNSEDSFELDCGEFDQDCNGQVDIGGTNLPFPAIMFIFLGLAAAVAGTIKWWENRNKK